MRTGTDLRIRPLDRPSEDAVADAVRRFELYLIFELLEDTASASSVGRIIVVSSITFASLRTRFGCGRVGLHRLDRFLRSPGSANPHTEPVGHF